MTDVTDYAIVDITEGRRSIGKVLVLVDDEQTAQEMAVDLTKRGCQVVVEAFGPAANQPVERPARRRRRTST
jgi:hypothetical protein